MGDLPGGAKIPVRFAPGQPLTAADLNDLQQQIMQLLLTHTHTGNDQTAPQGVQIAAGAIAPNAVQGPHISPNAVNKGDIHNGAVGASEIQEKCIAGNHLADEAVGTVQIKDRSVTAGKLSDEVNALLNLPREGATTYAYCAYLDGKVAYPAETGRWFDWLLDKAAPTRQYDLPIRRQRDDGGWQPIRSITPPEEIHRIQPTLDMTTRAEMAASLVSIFKQNEATVRELLGGPVTEVRSEGDHWSLTVGAGERMSLGHADVGALLGRLSAAGADLSRGMAPLRTSPTNLITAFEGLAGPAGESPGITVAAQPISRLPSGTAPIFRLPVGRLPSRPLPGRGSIWNPGSMIDPILVRAPAPAIDLQERSRTVMLVDPQAIGWSIAQEGESLFQPGVGGNAVFSESGEAVRFAPGQKPSQEEALVIERILYNAGIEFEGGSSIDQLLEIPKIYDFLNIPHLIGTGYWTGVSRNIRGVIRRVENGRQLVRILFTQPYANASYAVSVTPDFRPIDSALAPVSAHVLRRAADHVDLLFLQGSLQVNTLSFSIAIYGELVAS